MARRDPGGVTVVAPAPQGGIGGHLVFDRRLVEELRRQGTEAEIREIPGPFPFPDDAARHALTLELERLPAGRWIVLDNLVGSALPEIVARLAPHWRPALLVHHPLALEHGLPPEHSRLLWVRERTALAHVEAVLVPSRTVREVLVRDYGVPPYRITVIEPGIEEGPVATGSGGPSVRLLSLGAVIPRKDHLGLIRALAHLAHLPWELDIVGSLVRDPLTVERVRAAITAFGFTDRVRLLGERLGEAREEAFARADVFVSSARYEGYGLAILEAVARGLPVVARAGGAVAEVVPPEAVLLVPEDRPAALAEALERVIRDAELRGRLRAGALAARSRLPRWSEAATLLRRRLLALPPPAPVGLEAGRHAR